MTRNLSIGHYSCQARVIADFQWDVLAHLSYSPDLAPSDYYLFKKLKEHWLERLDDEVQGMVMT